MAADGGCELRRLAGVGATIVDAVMRVWREERLKGHIAVRRQF
jgi:hypothetical protein